MGYLRHQNIVVHGLEIDRFTESYVECALWASTDDDGNPLDDTWTIHDFSPEAITRIVEDCTQFQTANDQWLTQENLIGGSSGSVDGMAGHDFWLTRNGHGAGFWDGDWSDDAGTAMTEYSKKCRELDIYIGDDGHLHVA